MTKNQTDTPTISISIPNDAELLKLLKKAYKGEILCTVALIKTSRIKPFSDYEPKIKDSNRKEFKEELKKGKQPPIYVYPKGDKFIMSDDYATYSLCLENHLEKILCVVIGEPDSKYVIEQSEPFKLPQPTVRFEK